MIYFFQRADGDIKIGVTHDYHRRLQNLQTEHGKLTLLGLLDGGREAEEKLHYEFRAFRSHREWFSPDRSLLDFIAKNTHLNIPVRRRYSIRERGMRIISTDAPMKTGQLAALLGVSVGTVRNWLDHPLLQPY